MSLARSRRWTAAGSVAGWALAVLPSIGCRWGRHAPERDEPIRHDDATPLRTSPRDTPWSKTGNLNEADAFFAPPRTALLADGRVLVLKYAPEIYSPATGAFTRTSAPWSTHNPPFWVDVPDVPFRRADGKVVIVGTATTFDPVTDRWETSTSPKYDVASIHGIFGYTTTALAGGLVLVAGGNRQLGSLMRGSAEGTTASAIFDTATGAAVPTRPLHHKRGGWNPDGMEHEAVRLPDGRVLEMDVGVGRPVELFDPATRTWRVMSTKTCVGSPVALLDGRVLFIGASKSAAALYDPALDVWSAAAPFPDERTSASVTVLSDGRVMVAGGSLAQMLTTSVQMFDPHLGAWVRGESMNMARTRHAATLLADGRVLLTGGLKQDGATTVAASESEIFAP